MICHQHLPKSLDLNSIENIWCHMEATIPRDYSHITSQGEMMQVVQNLWNSSADDKWDNLVTSMPKRIQAVIDAKGRPTGY